MADLLSNQPFCSNDLMISCKCKCVLKLHYVLLNSNEKQKEILLTLLTDSLWAGEFGLRHLTYVRLSLD